MRSSLLCFLAVSVCPLAISSAMGAEAPASTAVEPLSRELITSESVLQLVIGLGVVVAAILFVAWMLRRVGAVSMNNGQLKVVAGLALGQRERVLLVQVGDSHQVLLGVTQGKISKLGEFSEPVVKTEMPGGEFTQRLRGVLKGQEKQPQ